MKCLELSSVQVMLHLAFSTHRPSVDNWTDWFYLYSFSGLKKTSVKQKRNRMLIKSNCYLMTGSVMFGNLSILSETKLICLFLHLALLFYIVNRILSHSLISICWDSYYLIVLVLHKEFDFLKITTFSNYLNSVQIEGFLQLSPQLPFW